MDDVTAAAIERLQEHRRRLIQEQVAKGEAKTWAETEDSYIVTYDGPPGKASEKAIEKLGGKVRHDLGLIDGLGIEVAALARLAAPVSGQVASDHH